MKKAVAFLLIGVICLSLVSCGPNINRSKQIIVASLSHTLGLKKDGTVVATGWNGFGECDVERWKDIVAFSAC